MNQVKEDRYVSWLLWGTGGFCFVAIVGFIFVMCCMTDTISVQHSIVKIKEGAQGIQPLETPKGMNGPLQPPLID